LATRYFSCTLPKAMFSRHSPLFLVFAGLFLASPCWSQGYTINTVAGGGSSDSSCNGESATQAALGETAGVAIDAAGDIYITDTSNSAICKVSGGVITTVAGGNAQGYSGDGGPATSAELSEPFGVAVDTKGNVYIADTYNSVIRKVNSAGIITTIAGNGTGGYSGDGGPATKAELDEPFGVAVDASGNVFIADTVNHVIRKVATDGTITTFAGNGTIFYNKGDGVPATSTGISNATGVAVDAAGNLYIATYQGFLVLKVTPGGIISTVAGNGSSPDSGDGGPATQASVNGPQSVAVDSSGNIYITEAFSAVVREIQADGTINTIAGNGTTGFSGDGGPALSAEISTADGIAISGGKIYLADLLNERIRVLNGGKTNSAPPSVSNGGIASLSEFGDLPATAPGSWVEIYGTNLATDSRSWGSSDFNGENAPTSLDGTSVSIGGQAAFVYYISPTQVDAQVPSNVATGSQPLIVKTPSGSSAPVNITINATEPGLLAPSSFDIGGKQYVVALFSDNITYVLPAGAIAGIPSRAAQPGETITMYGVGFGPVVPNVPAGQIVQSSNTLPSSAALQISFAGKPATLTYSGLAPTLVGLYQFDVVVPSVPASDTVPVTFSLGGVQGNQTLYIAVGN
jgi:uncharacterized protein (TIGR03437 family)